MGRAPVTGKQIQRSVHESTQKEVRQKLAQAVAAINNDDAFAVGYPVPHYALSLRYAKISAALVSGFTLGMTFSMTPLSSITKVERTTPMLTLP